MNHPPKDQTPEFDFNRALVEEGAQRAIDHAEAVEPGWKDRAYELALQYLTPDRGEFLGEEARAFAIEKGLPPPPDGRAWSGVMLRLKKAGKIVTCGIGQSKNASAHMGFVRIWRVAP